MTCIPAIKGSISLKKLKRNYLGNKKKFAQIFITLRKSTYKFEHFEKKVEPTTLSISKIIDSERCGYLNDKMVILQYFYPFVSSF